MSDGTGDNALNTPHLLERFVVHEARRILGYVELALLDMLAELPTWNQHPSIVDVPHIETHILARVLYSSSSEARYQVSR